MTWLKEWWMWQIDLEWRKYWGIPLDHLQRYKRRIPFIERGEFSQNGEDGILHAIFRMIGLTNRVFVEFGAEDGMQCNTRYLKLYDNWNGLWMDGRINPPECPVKREYITAENIESLLGKYGIPEEFDLLSIDIDGNDYWVWKAILHFRPRVVVVEYNASRPLGESVTILYDPAFQWDKTQYFGASLSALNALGEEKGYGLVATDENGVNAFFVKRELLRGRFVPRSITELFHAPSYKGIPGRGHPPDPLHRPWIHV